MDILRHHRIVASRQDRSFPCFAGILGDIEADVYSSSACSDQECTVLSRRCDYNVLLWSGRSAEVVVLKQITMKRVGDHAISQSQISEVPR